MSFTARQAQHQLRISARVKVIKMFKQERLKSTKALSYLNGTPLSLDLSIANLAVVNDNSIPTSAPRGGISPSNALGELGIRVGKEELFEKSKLLVKSGKTIGTHNRIPHSVHLAPCAHNKGIVESKNSNNIHTLLLQLGEVLDVSGNVVGGASGGKGTRNREKDDLLIRPLLGGIVFDWDSA